MKPILLPIFASLALITIPSIASADNETCQWSSQGLAMSIRQSDSTERFFQVIHTNGKTHWYIDIPKVYSAFDVYSSDLDYLFTASCLDNELHIIHLGSMDVPSNDSRYDLNTHCVCGK